MTEIDLVRMRRMIREIERLKWKIEKEQAYATRSSAALSELPWGRGNRSRVEEGAIRLVELKEVYFEIIEKLAAKYEGKLVVGKCDVEDNEDLAAEFGIRNIPTILFFKGGQIVDKVVGAQSEAKLDEKFQSIL